MARLIDADALRKKAQYSNRFESDEQIVFLDDIDAAPTVDAVPVVRCWQCKHGSKCTMNMIQCKMYDRFHRADWFCANGERRGGDE